MTIFHSSGIVACPIAAVADSTDSKIRRKLSMRAAAVSVWIVA